MPEQPSSNCVAISPGISRSKLSPTGPDVQGPHVARLVITQHDVERPQIEFQLSRLMQLPQVRTSFRRVGRDEPGVVGVEQVGIFLRQTDCRRRFGRHDVIALPHSLGQQSQIAMCELAGDVQGTHRDRRHARLQLIGMHKHGNVVVLQNCNQRFAELRVVPIGIDIDEVQDFAAAVPRRPSQPPAMRPANERADRKSRQLYVPGRCPATSPATSASRA